MDILRSLECFVQLDEKKLEIAKAQLDNAANKDFVKFMRTLSDILTSVSCSSVVRTAAGLNLKNQLTSKNQTKNLKYQLRWHQLSEDNRQYIKNNLISSLGTEETRPSIVAQCITYVAVAELPIGRWDTLIPTLLAILNDEIMTSNNGKKESVLYTIGYICQELNSCVLKSQSHEILLGIVKCLRKNEKSYYVRIAAAKALNNSLEFIKQNFDIDSEKCFIMQTVCDGIKSSNVQLTVASLECLVKIVTLYYTEIESYMPNALFPTSLIAMNSQNDYVVLQGIEFWSNIAEEEINLKPSQVTKYYALSALKYIFPVLLQQLIRHENYDSDDNWGPLKAAKVCIIILSECCSDAVCDYVLPFFEEYISSKLWQYRDAAVNAFGSILGGLQEETLEYLVYKATPSLVPLLYDPNIFVRDTTSWTFGKISDLVPYVIIKSPHCCATMEAFINCLKMESRIAANICWAIVGFSEESYNITQQYVSNIASSCCLSPYYYDILTLLFWNSERLDGDTANLRATAFEAILVLIKNAPLDCYYLKNFSTLSIMNRINEIVQMETHLTNHNDRSEFNDLQSLLCGTLQSVMLNAKIIDNTILSDTVIGTVFKLLRASTLTANIVEDAFETISVVVVTIKMDFIKHMDNLNPFILLGLSNVNQPAIFSKTINLIGDICEHLKLLALPYIDEWMYRILTNLNNIEFNQSHRSEIFEAFANIATGIGHNFITYLPAILDIMMACINNPIDLEFDECTLHTNCLNGLSDIVIALTTSDIIPEPNLKLLELQLNKIVQFVHGIAEKPDLPKQLIGNACKLVGKLCLAFGTTMHSMLVNTSVAEMISKSRLINHGNVSELARNAVEDIIQSEIRTEVDNQNSKLAEHPS